MIIDKVLIRALLRPTSEELALVASSSDQGYALDRPLAYSPALDGDVRVLHQLPCATVGGPFADHPTTALRQLARELDDRRARLDACTEGASSPAMRALRAAGWLARTAAGGPAVDDPSGMSDGSWAGGIHLLGLAELPQAMHADVHARRDQIASSAPPLALSCSAYRLYKRELPDGGPWPARDATSGVVGHPARELALDLLLAGVRPDALAELGTTVAGRAERAWADEFADVADATLDDVRADSRRHAPTPGWYTLYMPWAPIIGNLGTATYGTFLQRLVGGAAQVRTHVHGGGALTVAFRLDDATSVASLEDGLTPVAPPEVAAGRIGELLALWDPSLRTADDVFADVARLAQLA